MANFGLIADDRPLNRALRWVRRGKAMTLPSSAPPAGFARSAARAAGHNPKCTLG